MKTVGLVALVAGLIAVTTLLAPPVAAALAALGHPFPFTRVYNRVFEVLLVVALVLAWRRLDLGGPRAWGLRSAGWPRELAIGFGLGLAGLAVGLGAAWLGGALVPELRFEVAKTIRKAVAGLGAAAVVGVGEEVLFRGILLRRLVLDLGPRAGVVVTTAVYAVVHALRGGKVTSTGMLAGWERTAGLLAPLGEPGAWPGVAGLFLLGLLLAWVRRQRDSLWPSIGIHAAWVVGFRVGRLFFDIRRRPSWLVGPGWPPLVGGVAGVLAVAATTLLVRRWLHRRRHAAMACGNDEPAGAQPMPAPPTRPPLP